MPRWRHFVAQFEPISVPNSQYTFLIEMTPFPNLYSNSNATIDTWPRGTPHDYCSDARRAIIHAINDHWDELFLFTNDAGDYYDELVEADLLLPNFHTG